MAIDELVSEVAAKEAEIAPLKLAANTLARKAGITEPFQNVTFTGVPTPSRTNSLVWRKDHFYNRSLAGSVTEILEARKSHGIDGPASIDDLYDCLKGGGFRFTGTSGDENTKRAIKITLTKNTTQFSKIDEDHFGLKKWYGPARQIRKSNGVKTLSAGADSDAEDNDITTFDEDEINEPAEQRQQEPSETKDLI